VIGQRPIARRSRRERPRLAPREAAGPDMLMLGGPGGGALRTALRDRMRDVQSQRHAPRETAWRSRNSGHEHGLPIDYLFAPIVLPRGAAHVQALLVLRTWPAAWRLQSGQPRAWWPARRLSRLPARAPRRNADGLPVTAAWVRARRTTTDRVCGELRSGNAASRRCDEHTEVPRQHRAAGKPPLCTTTEETQTGNA